MAVVTSYTADRITELLSAIPELQAKQLELDTLIAQLKLLVESGAQSQNQITSVLLPYLEELVTAAANQASHLNDTVFVDVQEGLDENTAALNDLNTVTIPELQQDLASGIVNSLERPQQYFQDEAPTNPDADDRDLKVNDIWYDTNDGNKTYVWTGTEWSSFHVDIPAFSISLHQVLSSQHTIY